MTTRERRRRRRRKGERERRSEGVAVPHSVSLGRMIPFALAAEFERIERNEKKGQHFHQR
jgi:hypothetical protein